MTLKLTKTKLNIILAAQKLFGELGIDNVSLRKISEKSGNRNTRAAQYHFQTKENLVYAVLDYHRIEVDQLRFDSFQQMNTELDKLSSKELINLLIRPFITHSAENENKSFVRFLNAIFNYDPYFAQKGYETVPFSNGIYKVLRHLAPPLSDEIWTFRISMMGRIIVHSIADYDRSQIDEGIFIDEVIDMICRVLDITLS